MIYATLHESIAREVFHDADQTDGRLAMVERLMLKFVKDGRHYPVVLCSFEIRRDVHR